MIEKKMGYSKQEFLYQFKLFAAQLTYTLSDHAIEISQEHSTIQLFYQELPARSIGALKLPQLNIQIHFNGLSAQEQHHFMARFDRSFQKGGG